MDLYRYKAIVRRIYDGDTWYLDIDLGFDVWLKDQSIRLLGIDTPELRGEERPEGLIVRDWCREIAPEGTEVILVSHQDKSDKYGRWLGTLHLEGQETSVNQLLLEKGMAEIYA